MEQKANAAKFKARRKSSIKKGGRLFYVSMIALPLLQFLVFYVIVNFNSILMAFQNYDNSTGKEVITFTWDNFAYFFQADVAADLWLCIKNSLMYLEVAEAEYYDTDKTTLLHKGYVAKDAGSSYEYSAVDSEGYTKLISQWSLIEGSSNKFYAVKPSYSKVTTVAEGSYASLATLNKYIAVDSNGVATFKVKFTYSVEWTSFKFSANSGWTALEDTCNVGLDASNSGKWFTIVIDTTNDTVQVLDPDGKVMKSATGVTEDNILKYAFLPSIEMPIEILF